MKHGLDTFTVLLYDIHKIKSIQKFGLDRQAAMGKVEATQEYREYAGW